MILRAGHRIEFSHVSRATSRTFVFIFACKNKKFFLAIFRDGPSRKFFDIFQNIEQFLSYIKLLLIMLVNEAKSSELEALKQRIIDLEAENTKIKAEKA